MMEKSGLRAKLNEDLKNAMRSGDTVKRDTVRFLLSDIKYAEIAKQQTFDDAGIIGVISKEVRQRQESIDAFKLGNRPDLVAKEEAELAVIKAYLPQQVSRDEIKKVAERIIKEVGAKSPAEKGKVIPKVIAELKGKAGGQEISTIVTELLSSGPHYNPDSSNLGQWGTKVPLLYFK
jgi:uncharacterized protein